MELTSVESSHIAAIGYLEADRVLLVRYKDGSLYALPGWSDLDYQRLRIAPSKGKFLQAWKGMPAILISKGGDAVCDQSTRAAPAVESGPLNVLDEDAGKCCQRDLAKAFQTDAIKSYLDAGGTKLQCRECGQEFARQVVSPTVLHWRIIPQVAIVRRV